MQVVPVFAFYNVRVLRSKLTILAAVLAILASTYGQQVSREFGIATSGLPIGIAGDFYKAELKSVNGTPPIVWEVSDGTLPPGLTLDRSTGLIKGVPTQPGTFEFIVKANDGSNSSLSKRFVITIGTQTLNIIWKDYPQVSGGGINGGVEVSNSSKDTFDLTVIIVAVDEHNKAWALGYQHFNFPSGARQRIPFGTTLPNGRYVVHADAVGEVAAKDIIRRSRIQTPQSLGVGGGT